MKCVGSGGEVVSRLLLALGLLGALGGCASGREPERVPARDQLSGPAPQQGRSLGHVGSVDVRFGDATPWLSER